MVQCGNFLASMFLILSFGCLAVYFFNRVLYQHHCPGTYFILEGGCDSLGRTRD